MPSRSPLLRSRPLALLLLAAILALGRTGDRPAAADEARESEGDVTGAAAFLASTASATVGDSSGAPLDGAAALVPITVGLPPGPDAGGDQPPAEAGPGDGAAPVREADALGSALEGVPYPHPVQFLTVQAGGEAVRLAYMDVAPSAASAGATGRAALLLHGGDLGGDSWAGTIEALAGAGWRVIVPDMVGYGKSGKPHAPLTLDDQAAHAVLLLDSLAAPPVAVVGHALGAAVAARLAHAAPARVAALVLAAPVGLAPQPVPAARVDSAYQAELARVAPDEIRRELARSFAAWHPDYERLVRVRARVAAGGEYPRWARARARSLELEGEGTVAGALATVGIPALVVAGEQDELAPARCGLASPGAWRDSLEAAVGRSSRGAFVTLPGVGHVPQLEAPAAFHTLLAEFLDG